MHSFRHLDLLAGWVQFRLPQVQGPGHAGGALPFATFAIAAAAYAIAAAAAFTIAPNGHDKRAAAYAAPTRDLLRALSRDCDIVLQLSKLQWGRDMLAYRVRAQVPLIRPYTLRVFGNGCVSTTVTKTDATNGYT